MTPSFFAPALEVKVQGLTLSANVTQALIELEYENNLDTADMVTLKLNNADLSLTDSALFDVGKTVEVHLGYRGEDLQPMMLGEITAIHPVFPANGAPTVAITAYDKSHRMRHNTPERFTFKYLNDSVIAAAVAAENLLIPIVDPAPTPARESVQQTGSDWAFLKELALRNFFEVYVYWDRLYFRFPRPQTQMTTLEWGKNLTSFSPRLSTSALFGIQVLRGYDYKLAREVVAILPAIAVSGDLDDIVEKLGSSFIQQLVSFGRYVVRGAKVENYLDALAVAKSLLLQLLQGLYEGSGACVGMPQLRAGDYIEIKGVGSRFSGRYKLSKVVHTVGSDGYLTHFEVSQNANAALLQSLRKKLNESPSPNGQPTETSVVIGKVVNNLDPDNLGRVQVSIAALSDMNLSNWARVCAPMAGGTSGTYFLPDIGDEVLVTFESGNVDKPVVLGGMWNGQHRPPVVNLGPNSTKVIKMKSGMQIAFDETPATGSVKIEDGKGSSITMDPNTGNVTIQALNNVVIKAGPAGTVQLNP
jgi:phage protein D/phage baseplate assembly protein gpV